MAKIGGLVLKRVLTLLIETASVSCKSFILTGLRRRRESNPRIEVLQTPALPLGYPAKPNERNLGFPNAANEQLSAHENA